MEDRNTNRDATRKPNNLQRTPNNLQRTPNNGWVQLPLQFAPIPQVFGPAHNIKLRASDRHPVGKWRFVAWPQLDDVAAHVEQGGLFGTVPSTFALSGGLHLSALDVDRGDASKLTDAYPALASIPSWQPGRMHCYYPDTVSRPNSTVGVRRRRRRAYGAPMDFSRTTERGLLELADVISKWPNGPRCVPFPANLVRSPRPRQDANASRQEQAHALARPIACPVGLAKPLAKLRNVAIGHRHPALVVEASRWAGRQTWNGRVLDDAWLLRHLWRLALGMRHRLPDDEVAGVVGWAVSMRVVFAAMTHTSEWIRKQARRGRKGGVVSKGGGRPRKWASEAERLRASREPTSTHGGSRPGAGRKPKPKQSSVRKQANGGSAVAGTPPKGEGLCAVAGSREGDPRKEETGSTLAPHDER